MAVAHGIRTALSEIEQQLPEGFAMVVANDTSEYIEENINDVKFHMIFGGALAVAVIFFFLRNLDHHADLGRGDPDVDHRDLLRHRGLRLLLEHAHHARRCRCRWAS